MAGLIELRNALVKAIVRYHNKKMAHPALNEEEQVETILGLLNETRNIHLLDLITESTKSDETRRPILNFVFNAIKSLSTFTGNESANELNHLQQELYELVTNIQLLLTTYQWTQVAIQFDGQPDKVYGLAGALGGLSDSGTILIQTIFPVLKLDRYASKKEVELTINAIIKQAQIERLLSDNQSLLIDKNQLQKDIVSIKSEKLSLDAKLTSANTELEGARKSLGIFAGAAINQQFMHTGIGFAGGSSDCRAIGSNINAPTSLLALLKLGLLKPVAPTAGPNSETMTSPPSSPSGFR